MPKNAKKPQIRFKGFTDAWEQRKLGEIAETYSGGTPSVTIKKYYIGNIPFIRSAEINSKNTELFINEDALLYSSAKRVSVGDILYALYGATSGEVGRAALNGAINQAVLAILPQKNYDSEYLMQWLCKSKFKIIGTFLQGGQGNLSAEIVKNLNIDFPIYKEQIIIGIFLHKLDNLITLHQRKLDKLKNIKKSMLEKMFPKNGSNIPEIRFKGFTDAWEQRKLGDVGEIITGSTPSTLHPEYYSEEGLPWVTPTDINQNIIFNTDKKLSIYGEKVSRIVPPGSILVTCIASIGKNAMLTTAGSFNQQINGLIPNFKNYNSYFLLTASFLWSAKMIKEAAAGTMQIVNKNEFTNINTYIPTLKEQKIIGAYFNNLDNLITLHQRKLEKLQNIKKACLEKMFV